MEWEGDERGDRVREGMGRMREGDFYRYMSKSIPLSFTTDTRNLN